MTRSISSSAATFVLALGLTVSAVGAAPAEAQDYGSSYWDWGLSPSSGPALALGLGGIVAGVPMVVFTIADLYFAGQERLLPARWAIPQLLFGTGLAVVGVALAVMTDGDLWDLIGGVTAGVGGWFVAHALWSLIVGDSPPDRRTPQVAPLILPQEGGVVLGVTGML